MKDKSQRVREEVADALKRIWSGGRVMSPLTSLIISHRDAVIVEGYKGRISGIDDEYATKVYPPKKLGSYLK